MAEWKTIKSEMLEAGSNNFVEISIKQPPEGETEFIAISKGWTTPDGNKRYKSNILIPKNKYEELIEKLEKVVK